MKDILERLERKMDAGFARVEARFEQVDRQLEESRERDRGFEARFDGVDTRLDGVDARFDAVDARFDAVDARFDGVDAQLQKQGVLLEAVQGDVKMALEGIIGNREITDKGFADVLRKLDERVQPIELASRKYGRDLTARAKSATKRRRS